MAQTIIFTITEAGKQAALDANADSAQLKINLTQVAVGTGKRTVTGNESALLTEVKRGSIVSGDVEVSSNTLRFTSSMTSDAITDIYEVGLMTDDNVLFALASSTTDPLFSLHPNITFVIGFGLSLSDVAADSVTVTTDPNGTLAVVIMEQHLAALDPHPQYLNANRFQLLLQTLIPLGYQYATHTPVNPKPAFDELMGIDTWWRRITGKIMVATDPSDNYIKDVGIVLGRNGMTDLANQQRPNVYPLQTTHLFERYDPSTVIETVWTVVSSKSSVTEGAGVTFTVSANNLPDGQILSWTVKEGMLNTASNDIAAPDKSTSGTAILTNGQVTITHETTADDHLEEAQKHIRLTVGAPASLSMNVPINDLGNNEKSVHITQSTTSGLVLDEYYKTVSGAYPLATDKIRFIVDDGVDIIGADSLTPAIVDGVNWSAGSQIVVENRGRILGRGGDGGSSARYSQKSGVYPEQFFYDLTQPAGAGQNGATAIKGNIKVDNYGVISGGGGGGGGAGLYYVESGEFGSSALVDGVKRQLYVGGGGGSGGGAPYGARYPNLNSVSEFLERFNDINLVPPKENTGKLLNFVSMQDASDTYSSGYSHGIIRNGDSIFTPVPELVCATKDYTQFRAEKWTDGTETFYYSDDDTQGVVKQSQDATLSIGGEHGYDIAAQYRITRHAVDSQPVLKTVPVAVLKQNHGGNGGGLGENGADGVMVSFYNWNGETTGTVYKKLLPATGGLAGYIKEGAVTITNLASGTTKGR